MILVKRK